MPDGGAEQRVIAHYEIFVGLREFCIIGGCVCVCTSEGAFAFAFGGDWRFCIVGGPGHP